MIFVWENNNGKPREAKEYFNIPDPDGGYHSNFNGAVCYHGKPIENTELLKKKIKELEELFV